MDGKAVREIKKLSVLTCEKCDSECPDKSEYRCCDRIFCQVVEMNLKSPIEKPNKGGIPYMGERGCVVPPELRPACVAFMCEPIMRDRTFRRKYQRQIHEINKHVFLRGVNYE